MTFVSYSQNYEDVMLHRALSFIEKGFYIDVGAWSSDIDSVTRHFYESGWSGINIEPNNVYFEEYVVRRTRDINLNVAIGDKVGKLNINFVSNPGLSTAIDKIAEQHKAAGWKIECKEVELTTLASICKKYISDGQQIHFLKVDVEGLESEVIRGADWSSYRPWIVLVEATLPMTQTESYDSWESVLLDAGYQFTYADGLNRFYLANEHSELREAFKYPPNVFDDFLLSSQIEAQTKAHLAEVKAQEAEIKAHLAEVKAQEAEIKAHGAETKAREAEIKVQEVEKRSVHAIGMAVLASSQATDLLRLTRESTSWRVTAPLRLLGQILQANEIRKTKSDIKKLIKNKIKSGYTKIKRYSFVSSLVVKLVTTLNLKSFLVGLIHEPNINYPQSPVSNKENKFFKKSGSAEEMKELEGVLGKYKQHAKILIVRGDINSYSGYSKACGMYGNSLSREYDIVIGVDIHSHHKTNINAWARPQIREGLIPVLCGLEHNEVVILTVSSPGDFVLYEGAENIGMFFWETNRLGNAEWIQSINRLDELWVPVRFMLSALRQEGAICPIKVVPFPIDKSILDAKLNKLKEPEYIYKINKRGQDPIKIKYSELPKNKICILSTNTYIGRKGFPILLSELSRLEDSEVLQVILKTSSVDVGQDEKYLVKEIKFITDAMNIKIDLYLMPQILIESEMAFIEKECDIFVTTTYGEGFGLGVFEMYHAGKIVICPRHTSFEEYLPSNYKYFIECTKQNVALVDPVGVYPISATWGIPLPGELIRLLHDAIEIVTSRGVK